MGLLMYKYCKSSLEDNKEFLNQYRESLSSRYDTYLEEHILKSEIYAIYNEEIYLGYFGIYDNRMLTQFFIPISNFIHAQNIFDDILKSFRIKEAYVPTCDQIFLSLCLDKHSKVSIQAYFFEESNKLFAPAQYPRKMLKKAELSDITDIKNITGDFTDNQEDRIKTGQLYILRDGAEFLGLGIIEDNVIMKGCKGIGMFVNPKHRQKGVGRSIIIHLKGICHENGIIPVPGCWYYNFNSKKTLESAGFVSRTRLLRIEFGDDK